MFTKSGVAHRIAIGLDGGVYVCRWIDSLTRHRTPCWQVVGSEDQ
ncbi:MAG TPA: hypothetical protein VIM81_02055 [Gammaproteobacteria bacterium]